MPHPLRIKTDDTVGVIAGKDKGKEGEITLVMPKEGRAVVSGVNIVIRHTKQSQSAQGGRIPQEASIDLSNLALVDPKDGGATRVGFKTVDGKKVRFAKKSGEVIDA